MYGHGFRTLVGTQAKGSCGFIYFTSYNSGYGDQWGDDHPVIGEHLLPVGFVDEDEDINGQCWNAIEQAGGTVLKNWRIFQNKNDFTIETCLEACKYEKYAGLGSGQNCFCGDQFSAIDVLSESSCNQKCYGDSSQNCGGANKWNVYQIDSPKKFTGECLAAYLESNGGSIRTLIKTYASLTLEICLEQCKNFKYAGLGDGEHCLCFDNLKKMDHRPASECDKPCKGDPTNNKCGGEWRRSIYSIENPKPFTGQCIQEQGSTNCFLKSFGLNWSRNVSYF